MNKRGESNATAVHRCGTAVQAEFTQGEATGQPVTTVRLVLQSVASLFFVSDPSRGR
jgi:hypothetical protein